MNCIDFFRRQVIPSLLLQDACRHVLIQPDAVLLEALRISALQSLDIGALLEAELLDVELDLTVLVGDRDDDVPILVTWVLVLVI